MEEIIAQSFLTYEQQIDKLVNDKNLIIADNMQRLLSNKLDILPLSADIRSFLKILQPKNIKTALSLKILLHYINSMKT